MQKITMMETETTLMDSVWVSNYTEFNIVCNNMQFGPKRDPFYYNIPV